MRGELLDGCVVIVPCSCDVPFYSTVTGGLLDTGVLDGEYWFSNLREPVLFEGVTRALLGDGIVGLLRLVPSVLTVGVQETVDEVFAEG